MPKISLFFRAAAVLCAVTFSAFLSAQDTKYPLVGAQVFIEPGQSEQDVASWFNILQASGMQVCRIRLHESHINNNGKWDFSLYDRAFDLAASHGIKVFATLFPNDSKKSVGGEKFPESRKHYKEILTYVQKTVSHYKDHPALYAWVIQNEPGAGGVIPDNEFTSQKRNQWLKEKGYSQNSPFVTNSYEDETFLLDYESWYLGDLANHIKMIDQNHFFHVNNHQIFHNVAEYDFPAWRGFLSSLGASAHPSWHYGYFPRKSYPLAMAANCNLIKSGAGQLPYWVTELQAGNNIFSGTIPMCPTPEEITQWLWTCAANGSEGIIFWSLNPRSATGEPGEWALLTLDNQTSDRLEASKKFIFSIENNKDLFNSEEKYQCPVTVLYNRESLWAEKKMQHGGVRQDEARAVGAVMKETLGLYEAFADNGVMPSFTELREFDWSKGDYSGQLMVIAHQIAIPDQYVSKIEAFVRNGGRLIVTGLTGFWGSYNVCNACTDFLFRNLFGASFKEVCHVERGASVALEEPALNLRSQMWRSTISLHGARPVAHYGNEVTAVRNNFGRGEVLWIPALVGLTYRKIWNVNPLPSLLIHEMQGMDIPVRFASPQRGVYMNTMLTKDGPLTVIINKKREPATVALSLDENYSPEVIFAGGKGSVSGNLVNIQPEETLVVKWNRR